MKTKQPLCPSDVPPGSAIRDIKSKYCVWIIVSIENEGVRVWSGALWRWNDLKERCEILRPGQDWQPCYKEVEEFNASDYKPGQIVDVATARKLHAEGVGLEFSNEYKAWERLRWALEASDERLAKSKAQFRVAMPPGELTAEEAKYACEAGKQVEACDPAFGRWLPCVAHLPFPKEARYRLKPAPKIRGIRPDELPEVFHISRNTQTGLLFYREGFTTDMVCYFRELEYKWSVLLSGPWREFTVEEPQ